VTFARMDVAVASVAQIRVPLTRSAYGFATSRSIMCLRRQTALCCRLVT